MVGYHLAIDDVGQPAPQRAQCFLAGLAFGPLEKKSFYMHNRVQGNDRSEPVRNGQIRSGDQGPSIEQNRS
jgi:hypothetical protein